MKSKLKESTLTPFSKNTVLPVLISDGEEVLLVLEATGHKTYDTVQISHQVGYKSERKEEALWANYFLYGGQVTLSN